jgi:hypothetical protein
VCEHTFVAIVTVTASAETLDQLTDALGRQFHFTLRRTALEQLDAAIDGAAYPLVRLRVERTLEQLGLSADLA